MTNESYKKLADHLLDDLCEMHGPRKMIEDLLDCGYTREDLIDLSFSPAMIDSVIEDSSDAKRDADISLNDNDFRLNPETGELKVPKKLCGSNQAGDIVKIKFLDPNGPFCAKYKMVGEDQEYMRLEYVQSLY